MLAEIPRETVSLYITKQAASMILRSADEQVEQFIEEGILNYKVCYLHEIYMIFK